MAFGALRAQILGGSITRLVLLRAFMLATAISVFPLLQILSGTDPEFIDSMNFQQCDAPFAFPGTGFIFFKNPFLSPIWGTFGCKENANLTIHVARELMDMQMLDYSAKALCVGEGSASAVYALQALGFVNAHGVHRHPFFSLKQKKLVYELGYAGNSFDFVFSRDQDQVLVPAILVLEIERVLKPGGIGAMVVGPHGSSSNSLIRSAMPISSLLRASTVVHVGYVGELTLVVFKKRSESISYFKQFRIPADCHSVTNNKPLVEYLEPLTMNNQVDFEKKIAYLPKFIDMSLRKRLVYVDIGSGEHLNTSATNWFLPSYPVDHTNFSVYLVDHNTSVLLSCVKKPGVTFIYYPGLAGDKAANADEDYVNPYVGEEGFNFMDWFKETVQYADFVILKMNAGEVELKFLSDLFKSGTICSVDELFLACPDHTDGKAAARGECMDLIESLRSTGVYAHQWWDN